MKCPVCTQAVADAAPFCPYCGKVFDESRTEAERRTMPTGDMPPVHDMMRGQRHRTILTVILVTLAFAAGAIGLVVAITEQRRH